MNRFALEHEEDEDVVHIAGDPLGRSYTPLALAVAVLQRLRDVVGPFDGVMDPCAGGGAFLVAGRTVGVRTTVALDADPSAPALSLASSVAHAVDVRAIGDARGPRPVELARDYQVQVAATNPPFGRVVGQETTIDIVDRMREACRVAVSVMPLAYQGQVEWAPRVKECRCVWPIVGRVWTHEREMCAFVWDREYVGSVDFRVLEGRWKK